MSRKIVRHNSTTVWSSKLQVDMYYKCITTMIYYEVNKDKEDNN